MLRLGLSTFPGIRSAFRRLGTRSAAPLDHVWTCVGGVNAIPSRAYAKGKGKKGKKEAKQKKAPPAKSSSSSPAPASSSAPTSTKIVFNISDLTKVLDDGKPLFRDLTLGFYHGAKIGVLGINGSGKTSLLKILAGVDKSYHGSVTVDPGARIGYLEQEPQLDASKSVFENVMEGVGEQRGLLRRFEEISEQFGEEDADIDALMEEQAKIQHEIEHRELWDLDRRVNIALEALRCPDGDRDVVSLSGGEKRRVALCRLLIEHPDVLILDEPTNHLDAESVAWLETFLQHYTGAVVAVTHDRYFLDNVAQWILELDRGEAYPFKGNYSEWLVHKQKRLDLEKSKDAARAKILKREMDWIGSSPGARRAKNKARISAFNNLVEEGKMRKPESGRINLVDGPRLGTNVVSLENVNLTIDGKVLLKDATFKIEPGAIVGIIGPNGAGKTTLFKLISKELEPDSGRVEIGETVKLGYVSQTRDMLDPSKSIFEEISEGDELVDVGSGTMQMRAFVAGFNFKGTIQEKKVALLSGGERNRVHLAKTIKGGCNLLMLDEPTNDLDVETLRSLEDALPTFSGSAVIISHDRWFLDRTCTHILAFEGDGSVYYYPGSFTDYEYHKSQRKSDEGTTDSKPKKFKGLGF